MSKTPEGPSSADVKNNSEKLSSVLREMGRAAMKAAKKTWRTMIGRDSGEQAKDTPGTIAPEAPVKSGDTSPIAYTMSKEQLEALRGFGVEVITDPEYPVYPEPSFPEFVTTPDGRRSPVKSGNTPAAKTEPPKPTSRDIPENERWGVVGGAAAAEAEPPKPKRIKWKNIRQFTVDNAGNTPTAETNGDTEKSQKKTEMSVDEYEAATTLKLARERFAKASIAVETHFFKEHFGGKKRQAELEAATEQLKKSELEYMRLKFADKIEAAKQDPEKQAELAAEMAQAAFASMQETSRMTTDKYDNMLDDRGKFKKAAAKVGKWFNKGGKIAQWLKLGGTGFVGGAIVGSVAAWPITTAVGIVTELGVAGATKQAVLEERRGEDRIDDDSLEAIDPSFKDTVANMKIDDVMKHAVNVSIDNLKDVSIERQDALRKKVRSSLGKYGAGFALGGFAGKFAGDWANSAHATGAESNTTTPPQSGSGQIPQQPSGASSMDNSIAKTIVNNINPDTSNFNSYDYPWDWAAEKFGDANAMDQLHNLADKAMANGHTVEWFNNPDGSVWMKVDGSSATKDVLDVLSRYV